MKTLQCPGCTRTVGLVLGEEVACPCGVCLTLPNGSEDPADGVMRYTCRVCGKRLKARVRFAGTSKCPRCGQVPREMPPAALDPGLQEDPDGIRPPVVTACAEPAQHQGADGSSQHLPGDDPFRSRKRPGPLLLLAWVGGLLAVACFVALIGRGGRSGAVAPPPVVPPPNHGEVSITQVGPEAVTRKGDVLLAITAALVEPIRLEGPAGPGIDAANYLSIRIRVENLGTNPVVFRGWAGTRLAAAQTEPRLVDRKGVVYQWHPFKAPQAALAGQAREPITVTTRGVDDILVFDVPVGDVDLLTLELPASAVGQSGVFTLRIPSSAIRR